MNSALRCEALRESLLLSCWWRMEPRMTLRRLAGPEVEPASVRVSMTSSIDLRPKFGIAFSSDSDFCSRSPTVWMPARFRQLYERTPSSSSSIRMSSIPSGSRPPRGVAAAAVGARRRARRPGRCSASRRSWSVKIASDLMRISAASRSAACGATRAVGLDVERELVVVGPLADARGLDLVGDALDRREDRVDRDHADRLVRGLVVLGRRVAAAVARSSGTSRAWSSSRAWRCGPRGSGARRPTAGRCRRRSPHRGRWRPAAPRSRPRRSASGRRSP